MKKYITIIILIIAVFFCAVKLAFIKKEKDSEKIKNISLLVEVENTFLQNAELNEMIEEKFNVKLNCAFLDNEEIIEKISSNENLENYDAVVFSKKDNINTLNDLEIKDLNYGTPFVFYSWNEIVDLLIEKQIVSEDNGISYISDIQEMFQYMLEDKKWKDIGMNCLFGNVIIDTMNLEKTKLGQDFFKLFSLSFRNDENIEEKMNHFKNIYLNSEPIMDRESSVFLKRYLKEGMKVLPIIVGYEKDILDFINKNSADYKEIEDDIKIIYPTQTVFKKTNMISLNPNGDELQRILKDSDVQLFIWKNYGIRNDVAKENYTEGHRLIGIPEIVKEIKIEQ